MKLFKSKKAHSSSVHIMIGFVVLFILYSLNLRFAWVDIQALNYSQIAFIFFVTWVYSQMPDIDLPNSNISRYVTLFGLALIIYSFYQGNETVLICTAIVFGAFRLVTHRTVIHSLIAGIIISLPLYLFNPLYGIIALIMFLAHIISENEFSIWKEKDWRIFK